ncbi:hypothetical protein ACFE04_018910 [Oxalis oulophora]
MVITSSRKSSGPVLRSLSPSGRYYSPNQTTSLTSAFASSSSSSFSSTSAAFFNHHHSHSQYYHHDYNNHNSHHHHHHRSSSPTRVNIYTSNPINTPSFSFSLTNRSTSPSNRSIAVSSNKQQSNTIKKTCMCSPTNHPGSFRCSLHKNSHHQHQHHGGSSSLNSLNMRRSAMKNSLVRIGGVEGDWVKRALTALIRPSSHQQKRREGFQARPSRLSVMSKAQEDEEPL